MKKNDLSSPAVSRVFSLMTLVMKEDRTKKFSFFEIPFFNQFDISSLIERQSEMIFAKNPSSLLGMRRRKGSTAMSKNGFHHGNKWSEKTKIDLNCKNTLGFNSYKMMAARKMNFILAVSINVTGRRTRNHHEIDFMNLERAQPCSVCWKDLCYLHQR